jgi:protein O-GlcNAc transferase
MTIAEAYALAMQHHQSGNLLQAEQIYRLILQADPNEANAHHLLGVVACQRGQADQGVQSIRRAIALFPTATAFHCNLGAALESLGQSEEAAASFRQALLIDPANAAAHYNLAKTLHQGGALQESIEHYQTALQYQPVYPEAQNGLSSLFLTQGKHTEAEELCRAALANAPTLVEAHVNLALALQKQGKTDAAIASLKEALRLDPNYAIAWNNLGVVFRELGQRESARQCLERAVQLKPDFAEAQNNLGTEQLQQGNLELALASFRKAVSLQPRYDAAWMNLAGTLNYDPEAAPEEIFDVHRRWGQLHEPAQRATSFRNHRDPQRRLRIGYVSPDLRYHALARYLEPVLANHDPVQVELYCYAEAEKCDAVTARLQKWVPAWRNVAGQTDQQVYETIQRDGIDILIDLAGYTAGNRLPVFAMKPAPVQATWLGYLNTTGLAAVDYRVTDDILDPPEQPVYGTERLMRLPGGFCCFGPPEDAPAVAPLPALSVGYLTFGSLHNVIKVNRRVFDLWSLLLRRLPKTRLLMFHHTLTRQVQQFVRREFEKRSIEVHRLDLREGHHDPGYLEVYREIDISLDAFPCTGGVSTCESLWMGVPMLTLCGARPMGRNSSALLSRVGLCEWIAQSPEEYVNIASGMAQQFEKLASLRGNLRSQMAATLCDAPRFTQELENAYRQMWRKWCAEK